MAQRGPRAGRRAVVADAVTEGRGARLVLEPVELERDEHGWPLAFWALAGAAPDFDLGERPRRHERGDVLARRRRP